MNPANYLHLPQVRPVKVDIRGSKIAVYYLFRTTTKHASALVINFQDGRWKKIVEEPMVRLRDIYRDCDNRDFGRDPFGLQIAVLVSVLRWWNNSLNSFNDQLIAYEETLLLQDTTNEDLHRTNAEINQSLHCMAAHLHRYGSELRSLSEIISDIKSYNEAFDAVFIAHGVRSADTLIRAVKELDQAASHAAAISTFRDELQHKIDNILALLVDNTQAHNDQLLVQNSKAMQEILKATEEQAAQSLAMATQTKRLTEDMAKILQQTQQETEASRQVAIQSQRLSEKMMEDSVAMKTIALLTAFFLPGTSFAAILALPFFKDKSWFNSTAGIWIWVVATIPSTLVCFLFYWSWSRRELVKKEKNHP
ncbi:uncharacterized protein BDR25DRAFT_327593 [Lindgomyces ingoldianus]|uniref:Uncharacterized protein n=1 Tax=Lindgomyces ingoldianus TaxID=673940 RepID=A0ACB6QK40_9PLEO|nr:uncharacterized protein BDR25DRAFT_327593 [Lindgomyces ingoldianus]KAF2466885.1 hypothetical protein BDR25DRAFT_327593 [Lindgomyces ingoldianus]